jgi:hypothetical protein
VKLFTNVHRPYPVILGLGVWGVCINPIGLRPVHFGFMQVWARITGIGAGFMHERYPSRRGRPRKGLGQGSTCMELRWIPGDPRINPARRGGERGAFQGWKGMQKDSPTQRALLAVLPELEGT